MLEDYTKLNELKLQVAALERDIAAKRQAELQGLQAKYGFDSLEGFITALRSANPAPVRRGRKPGRKAGAPAREAAPEEKKARRKRATITDEMRVKVKELAEAGQSSSEIATAVGISVPSVQNIKKAFGLTNPRS